MTTEVTRGVQSAGVLATNDVKSKLQHLLYPSSYKNLYKSGWKPQGFNQQWGGSFGGESPNGTGEDKWFETGNILNNNNYIEGHASNTTWEAQSFKTSHAITLEAAWLKIFKVGNPQKDTEPLSIQICSAIPNGSAPTIIANGTANAINGHDMTTAENWPITSNTGGEFYRFTFAVNPTLSADTTYYLVLHGTGADAANYFRLCADRSVAPYPFGSFYVSDDATPTTWSVNSPGSLAFLIEPEASSHLIQSGGEFNNKISFSEGTPINQSKALNQPYVNFSDKEGFTIRTVVDAGLTASKTLMDIHWGMDHDRIRIYTDATPNICIEVYEKDGTKHVITDGAVDVSSGKLDLMWAVRTKNDGSDFVKQLINGVAEGTQLSSQSIEMDANFHQLATFHLGGGFPIAPTWTDDQDMSALPSADGDWAYGGTATEAAHFSVQNGKLYQNIVGSTDASLYHKATGGLSNANGWEVTWKSQITQSDNTTESRVSYIDITDGVARYRILMHEYYVETTYFTTNFKYQIDLTDKEHIFKLQAKGSDAYLYIDGNLIFDLTGLVDPTTANNEVNFGDNTTGAGSNADVIWDYFKHYVTSNLPIEVNDCTISEFSYWSGDKTGIALTAYNAGSPISTKQLAGIKEDYVKVISETIRLQGITASPTTTSTTPVLLTDMEAFVLSKSNMDVNFINTVYSANVIVIGAGIFVDGIDVDVETNTGSVNTAEPVSNQQVTLPIFDTVLPKVGLHKVEIKWQANANTGISLQKTRRMTIKQGE